MPWPPPMQSVTMPRLSPSRFIAWSSRVVSTAPVAPIGWPWAIAPPSTIDDVFRQAKLLRDGERNGGEGLVDLDPLESESFQPARSSALRTAGTGPMPNMPGSTAATP